MTAKLKTISGDILNSRGTQNEADATHELGVFYKTLLTALKIKADSVEFTHITGGVALSPQHAIDCLEDGARTARFLKGIFKAITHALDSSKDRPLEVLYAGCGPLATLLVPLLPHFNSDQLRITLLDIHEESIESSRRIIEHLDLTDFFVDLKTCDATKYEHSSNIDLLITETMDKGLTREPQVSISEHLCQYLSPEGILIPKQISLYAGTAIFSELPNCKTSFHVKDVVDTIEYDNFLFSINQGSKISNQGFESELIDLPEDINSKPEICIFTEIEIFGGIFLKAGDAQITDPICVLASNCIEAPKYTFSYTTKPNPSWSIKQKNGTE